MFNMYVDKYTVPTQCICQHTQYKYNILYIHIHNTCILIFYIFIYIQYIRNDILHIIHYTLTECILVQFIIDL